MKYEYPLTMDLVFKGVFGRDTEGSRSNLRNLLNAILTSSGEPPIVDLIIKNPLLFGESFEEKKPILDIKAKLDTGEQINIEVQVKKQEFFADRATYYLGKLHGEQLDQGEQYEELVKTIHIHIVDFKVCEIEKLHTVYRLMEVEEHIEFTDAIEIHCLQLPFINDKIAVEDMDILSKWMKVIRDINKPKCEVLIDDIVIKEEVIAMAIKDYRKITQEDYLRECADAIERGERLRRSEMGVALRKGMEKGLEEGIKQEKLTVAKKLLNKGLSIEEVSEVTELPIEVISQIK